MSWDHGHCYRLLLFYSIKCIHTLTPWSCFLILEIEADIFVVSIMFALGFFHKRKQLRITAHFPLELYWVLCSHLCKLYKMRMSEVVRALCVIIFFFLLNGFANVEIYLQRSYLENHCMCTLHTHKSFCQPWNGLTMTEFLRIVTNILPLRKLCSGFFLFLQFLHGHHRKHFMDPTARDIISLKRCCVPCCLFC